MNRQVRVGLVVLAGIVLLYLVISWTKNSGLFSRDYVEYRIFFKNVNGLKTSDPVTMYGYTIGKVHEITPQDSGMIVSIQINRDTKLYSDASAKLLVKEIMGNKQVELLPGTAQLSLLQPSHLIKGLPTFDFTTAMDQIGQVFQNIKPQTIQKTIENLEKISTQVVSLTDSNEINKIKTLINHIKSTAERADRLLFHVEQKKLTDKIEQITNDLLRLTVEAEKSLHLIQKLGNKADTLIPKINNLITRTEIAIIHADSTILDVKKTLDELKTKQTLAGRLLYDPILSHKVDTSLKNLDSTLDHFRNKSILVKMVLKRIK